MDVQKCIKTTYKVNNNFVYEGLCDGIPTKWITKNEWNKKINIKFINNEIIYTDNFGNKIIILEEDDDDWNNF